MTPELNEKEQAIVNEAIASARQAVMVANEAQRQAQKAGDQVQAVFRTILKLKGVNPDGYALEIAESGEMHLREVERPKQPPTTKKNGRTAFKGLVPHGGPPAADLRPITEGEKSENTP